MKVKCVCRDVRLLFLIDYFQLEILYDDGARSFLFLTVPPTDRAPLILEQGPTVAALLKTALADYNQQLAATARRFQSKHPDINRATVFDTQPIFNTLLDNAETFGFVNSTGFCEAYENGTPSTTTQIPPCAPVSNYLSVYVFHATGPRADRLISEFHAAG